MTTTFLPIHVALEAARREMGKAVKFESFDDRQIGKSRVATLYFSVVYKHEGLPARREFRSMVFVDGKNKGGMIL